MDDLTQAEIDNIVASNPELGKWFCVTLVHYMLGYLRRADDIMNVRQDFFKQIKTHLLGKRKVLRDYEPEQAHGTAIDFQEHQRYGGTREDY